MHNLLEYYIQTLCINLKTLSLFIRLLSSLFICTCAYLIICLPCRLHQSHVNLYNILFYVYIAQPGLPTCALNISVYCAFLLQYVVFAIVLVPDTQKPALKSYLHPNICLHLFVSLHVCCCRFVLPVPDRLEPSPHLSHVVAPNHSGFRNVTTQIDYNMQRSDLDHIIDFPQMKRVSQQTVMSVSRVTLKTRTLCAWRWNCMPVTKLQEGTSKPISWVLHCKRLCPHPWAASYCFGCFCGDLGAFLPLGSDTIKFKTAGSGWAFHWERVKVRVTTLSPGSLCLSHLT